MRYSRVGAVVAISLVLAACGGGGGGGAPAKSTSTTSTSVASASTRMAKPHSLAYIVTQVDDQLRPIVAAAEPCLHGPHGACTGRAVDEYNKIDELAGAVSFLRDSVTRGSQLYAGDLPQDLVSLYDETLNAGAAAHDASKHAQEVCLPSFPPECDTANATLDDALTELYKAFNAWRRYL